jgi:hypothetical protein
MLKINFGIYEIEVLVGINCAAQSQAIRHEGVVPFPFTSSPFVTVNYNAPMRIEAFGKLKSPKAGDDNLTIGFIQTTYVSIRTATYWDEDGKMIVTERLSEPARDGGNDADHPWYNRVYKYKHKHNELVPQNPFNLSMEDQPEFSASYTHLGMKLREMTVDDRFLTYLAVKEKCGGTTKWHHLYFVNWVIRHHVTVGTNNALSVHSTNGYEVVGCGATPRNVQSGKVIKNDPPHSLFERKRGPAMQMLQHTYTFSDNTGQFRSERTLIRKK